MVEDEEDENHTLVTASHAIFRDDGIKHAPVAVVGFQFYYSALYTQFVNTVSHVCSRKGNQFSFCL